MKDFREYELGINIIDEQHQNWFKIYYELVALVNSESKDTQLISEIIEKLYYYTNYHFKFEEEFLNSIGYPHREEHRQNHKRLDDSINWYYRQMGTGKIVTSERILHIMEQWILTHILVDDRAYVEYINRNQLNDSLISV